MNSNKKMTNNALKEAFQGTTPRTASSWESNMIRWPVGATSNSGASESNFLNRAKEDEENAKAPKIKPYPLDFIGDNIVDVYTSLINLKNSLKSSIKYPDLSTNDKNIIKREIKKINIMIEHLQKMFYTIDKITL